MTRFLLPLLLLCTLLAAGCGEAPEGSQESARQHFDREFQKWIAGEENEVTTMKSRLGSLAPPISYDIRSVVSDSPDPLAVDDVTRLPEDWETWPAYKMNVAIEWKSEADTPLEKVTTYTLTWNALDKQWHVAERF